MYAWTDGAYLMHHGILGQKWGVRRFQNEDGSLTDAGRKKYLVNNPSGIPLSKRQMKKYKDVVSSSKTSLASYKNKNMSGYHDILNNDGKVIGEIDILDKGDTSHIEWIGIRDKYQRNGHGQEALKIAIDQAISNGKKYVTLDAAGIDPAARHIYEKMGFEAIDKIDDYFWNDLIVMRKKLV